MEFSTIQRAHARIGPHVHETPVLQSQLLNERYGAELVFKCENLQKVGAFKARGALNAVLSLDEAARRHGLATHSSGNHGAALAYAGQITGTATTVVMPEDSLPNKIAAVRGYGAEVILCPALERDAVCERLVKDTGAVLIHPYDDDRIIAGQGTAALEFLEQTDSLDVLIVPVGGGGLLAGTAVVGKSRSPGMQILGAEPDRSDDAIQSFATGERQRPRGFDTIADGLRAALGVRNFELIYQHADAILPVSEAAIIDATRTLMHYLKVVVEPSAAVPLAAIADHPHHFAGKRVGIILSGGNLDLDGPPWLTERLS